MKKIIILVLVLCVVMSMQGCALLFGYTALDNTKTSEIISIDISNKEEGSKVLEDSLKPDEKFFEIAFLGYEKIEDLDYYLENYIHGVIPPIHYISAGEYYLIVPTSGYMKLEIYKNDFDTSKSTLIYEDTNASAFIIQCNFSDIFADATIKLISGENSVTFTPHISLKSGELEFGESGIDITKSKN